MAAQKQFGSPPSSAQRGGASAYRGNQHIKRKRRSPVPLASGIIPPAAHERPLFDRSAVAAASGEASSAHKALNAKRQLMPAIPIRRGSAHPVHGGATGAGAGAGARATTAEDGKSKPSSDVSKPSTPLQDGVGAGSSGHTNIQGIAQAIAARAQHVAAGKRGAEGSHRSLQSTSSPALRQLDGSKNIPTDASEGSNDSLLKPGGIATQGDSSNTLDPRRLSVLSHAPSLSDYGDGGSSIDHQDASVDARNSFSAASFPTSPQLAEAGLITSITDPAADRNSVAGSFRWSQVDWAEYAAALSSTISAGDSRQSGLQILGEQDAPAQATADISESKLLPAITSQQDESKAGPSLHDKGAVALGLGIGGTGLLPPDNAIEAQAQDAGEELGTTSARLPTSYSTGAITDSPIPGANGLRSSARSETLHSLGQRRKSRPSALNLSSPMSPASMSRSPSSSRCLASPSHGGRTPPPTMPPAEPLPPLPAEAATLSKSLTASDGWTPRIGASNRESSDSSVGTDSISHSGSLPTLGNSMSERRSSANDVGIASSGQSSTRHRSTKSNAAPLPAVSFRGGQGQSLGARSAALVDAHNASTLAEAQRVEGMLQQIWPPPTYDESHTPASDHSGGYNSRTQLESRDRRQTKRDGFVDRETESSRLPQELVEKGTIDEKNNKESVGEGGEEEDEAVITSVTGTHNPEKGNPTLFRTNSSQYVSSLTRRRSSGKQSEVAQGATAPRKRNDERDASANEGGDSTLQTIGLQTSRSIDSDASAAKIFSAVQPQKIDVHDSPEARAKHTSTGSVMAQTGDWTPSSEVATNHDDYAAWPAQMTDSVGSHVAPSQSLKSAAAHNRFSGAHTSGKGSDDTFSRAKGTESASFGGAFGEVSLAFKQLQAEKRTLEKIIRATTPLDGLSDTANLADYLASMPAKLDLSAREIRKLLELLDRQRSVMDYMIDTHQLELDAHIEELNELHAEFEAVEIEADTHRANAVRLTDDLDKANQEAVSARAELLRFRTSLGDEKERRENANKILGQTRDDLTRVERERDLAREAERQTREELRRLQNNRNEGAEKSRRSMAAVTGASSDAERIAALQHELAQVKITNADLEKQLQHSPAHSVSPDRTRGTSIGSPALYSESDDADKEALRDKILQQEKDIAELRAQIALGAAVTGGDRDDVSIAALHGSGETRQMGSPRSLDRADQVRALMAQMSEQRTREAQIRTAFRALRDDLRKMQSIQQQDRKRTHATKSLLGAQPTSPQSGEHTGKATVEDLLSGVNSAAAAAATGPTPRQLKRLSLPLVNQAAAPLLSAGGAFQQAPDSQSSLDTHPPSAFTSFVGGGAPRVRPTPNKRSSWRYSVDFSSPASLGGHGGSNASMNGHDTGPSPFTREYSLGGAAASQAGAGVSASQDSADAHMPADDDEKLEQLNSPPLRSQPEQDSVQNISGI